jgi:hypothetical protein
MSDDQPLGAAERVLRLADYRHRRRQAGVAVTAPVPEPLTRNFLLSLEALRRAGCTDELDALLRRHIEGHLAAIARRCPELTTSTATVLRSLDLLLRLRAGR